MKKFVKMNEIGLLMGYITSNIDYYDIQYAADITIITHSIHG